MSRPDRWWRPRGARPSARPPVRSPRRARYAAQEKYMDGFNLGMDVGVAEERKRHEERERKFREREEQLRRLADASEAASNGDHGPMDELMREAGFRSDDLLDVADAAGVMPDDHVGDATKMVDELDRYERNLDMVHRMAEASAAGPVAFAALAAEWGVPPEVLRKTSIDHILDVVEAAQMTAEIEAWLRGDG